MDLSYDTTPHYTCHKTVGALEIIEVGNYVTSADALVREVTFTNGNTAKLPDDMFQRYVPVPGDFLVIYPDGYMSFSPRKAFLDGYKAVDDRTFADIKQEIRQ